MTLLCKFTAQTDPFKEAQGESLQQKKKKKTQLLMYFLHKAELCGEAHASHVLKANELSPRDQDAAILKLYTCSLSINKQKQTNKKRN